ncbi:potassium channel family protein [Alkalimarinus alittae]|uniref:Potassium channel family protein n=1 Tax=Alkalimarinus alittae TaxID=2961619 RepID=A0ABY6N6L1_9ALTE|nr:potassium channel family protein [Alkalimarinus alittae]UZE97624.1 potassium channel family protein [Alkalimarinus alittae]
MNLVKGKPFVWTGVFVIVTITLGLLPSLSQVFFTGVWITALIICTILVFLLPVSSLAYHIHNFYGKSLRDLLILYVEAVIIFGCAYFLIGYLGQTDIHFHGVDNVTPELLNKNPELLFTRLIEYIHFSLVTVSTVGFGNIYPKSVGSLVVTAGQIMLGLYTVVIGVSSALSIVVNKKIAAEEEAKKIPLRLAAYEDISVYVNRMMRLFMNFYKHSVPSDAPIDMKDFFSVDCMETIYGMIDLNGRPDVIPDQDWWSYIPEEAKNIIELGEKVLVRHAGHIDPEIYSLVHSIAESPELLTMKIIPRLKNLPIRENHPPILAANAATPSHEFLTNILKLHSWCCELKQSQPESNSQMRGLFEYNPNFERRTPPASMYSNNNEPSKQLSPV